MSIFSPAIAATAGAGRRRRPTPSESSFAKAHGYSPPKRSALPSRPRAHPGPLPTSHKPSFTDHYDAAQRAISGPTGLAVGQQRALHGPTPKSLLGLTDAQYRHVALAQGESSTGRVGDIARLGQDLRRRKGEPSTLEALTIASLGLPIGPEDVAATAIAKLGGRYVPKVAELLGAGGRAARAESAAGKAASTVAKADRPALSAADRSIARRALARAGRPAQRAARSRVGVAAAKVAEKPAVRVAGRAARLPLKYRKSATLGGPLALQAPAAFIHGDPKQFLKGLEGTGTFAHAAGDIGSAVGSLVPGKVAQNAVHDAFALPAQVLPSVYLTGAGAFEAAKGNPSRLNRMWNYYKRTGLLPAIVKGDSKQVSRALTNHPVYSALEASGAAAAAGRVSGAAVRGATLGRVAGTARHDLHVKGYPNIRETGRRYSPDLGRQLIQRAHERIQGRGGRDAFAVSHAKAMKLLRERTDRFVFQAEQVRRGHRAEAVTSIEKARPGRRGGSALRRAAGVRDNAAAGVVSLAVQRIIRSPKTFHGDLAKYKGQLERAYQTQHLTRSEKAANRALVKAIDAASAHANPEAVFAAADHYNQTHGPMVDALVQRGLLDPAQAEKASAIPFARVHLGAQHGHSNADMARIAEIDAQIARGGLSDAERRGLWGERSRLKAKSNRQTLDVHGNPLSLDQIRQAMHEQGAGTAGFLTQKSAARGPGSFYRSFFPDRQKLPTQRRTGEATARGTFDASYGALTEQAARTRGIADAVTGFDAMIKRFGVKPPQGYFKTFGDAKRALLDPQEFGLHLPAGMEFQPFRIAPFGALKRELDAAKAHQSVLDPQQESLLGDLTGKALVAGQQDGPGHVVLLPKALVQRMEQHHPRLRQDQKAAQVITGGFKSAILPTSPSWIYGNALDVAIRSALSGLGPFDTLLGHRIAKGLEPGAKESIITGSHFSAYGHVQPYRDATQFAEGRLAPFARALGTVRRTPGPKQAIDLYIKYRDAVFALNSKFLERQPQFAALGKEARREMQARTGYWHHALMLGDGAISDLTKGLRSTDKQIAYAKAVEEVFGNWGKNGPVARALGNYAPFWMWARAASRFVLLTMPAHHPITTGLIAASEEMTQQERQKFGLDKFGHLPLPGFLQGGLPLGGGVSPWSKYSSFGVFADYPGFISNVLLPQVRGGIQAFSGLDWKGDQLVDSKGRPVDEPTKVAAALLTTGESYVPFLTMIRTLNSGGPDKAFNPIHTYPKHTVNYLRSLSQQQKISVPAKGTSSGSSSSGFSSAYDSALSGGGGAFTSSYEKALGK